jgi:hypothetical protein
MTKDDGIHDYFLPKGEEVILWELRGDQAVLSGEVQIVRTENLQTVHPVPRVCNYSAPTGESMIRNQGS